MMVGYISAVYMYTTEKLPAAQSFPARASAVLAMKNTDDITSVYKPECSGIEKTCSDTEDSGQEKTPEKIILYYPQVVDEATYTTKKGFLPQTSMRSIQPR